MALMSVFTPKKKPQDQIQGSGYSSAYASNASTYKPAPKPAVKASNYNTQNYLTSLTKQPSFPTAQKPQMSVAPKQPVKIQTPNILPWGTNTGAMPWGQKQPQTAKPRVTGQMSTPRPTGGMSVAPKAPQMSVDTNYRKPEPIRQVEAPQPEQPAFNMMDFLSGSANRRADFAQNSLNDENSFIKQKYGLANQQLRTQLPVAEERFGQFKGDTEAMIADLIAGGEREKASTEDYYGDAQRQAAQTRRETQGQTQRTFANLGTLDSRGEGSFQQATENADSEFNRFTQQTLRAKADKLSEIETAVRTGERQARQVIVQEQQKLEDLARSIEFAVQNNNLQEAKELTDAFNQTQNYIYDIEDNLASAQYEFAKAQQDLQNEIAKTQSFTPEFMATGNPTNQAEYEFLIKNKDAMSGVYGTGGTSSSQKATSIIDDLMKVDTAGITGKMRIGFSDESRAAEGLLKQLSSELQIEEAKRLKGQGAMSDAERAILANSIAAFNLDSNGRPNVSDTRFRQILEELRAGFSGQESLSSILG